MPRQDPARGRWRCPWNRWRAGAVRRQHAPERVGVGERDLVHPRDADGLRGMAEPEEDRAVVFRQAGRKPAEARLPEPPAVGSRLLRVEEEEPARGRFEGRLHETVLVRRQVRDGREERRAVVVVAQDEVAGTGEAREDVAKEGVGLRVPLVRQVARDDHHRGARGPVRSVPRHDGVHRRPQPRLRVEAVEALARGDEVQVGEVDDVEGRHLSPARGAAAPGRPSPSGRAPGRVRHASRRWTGGRR